MQKAMLATLTALLSLPFQAGSAQGFPVTVEHKYGSTTLEAAPERIVALGATDQDPLFALGAKPIADRFWYGDYPGGIFPWAQTAADSAEPEVLEMAELDFERILSLDPDLITAAYSGLSAEEYEKLSQIAPTLAQSGSYPDWTTPWQVVTQDVGSILGKAGEAEALVNEVEAEFDQAREQNPEFDGIEIAVYLHEFPYGGRFLYGSEGRTTQFFTNLGFVSSPAIDEALGAGGDVLSLERTDLLDVDLLVALGSTNGTVDPNDDDTEEEAKQKLLDDELISQLDVIKDGRVVYVTGDAADAINFNTVLSIPFALTTVLPDLNAAVSRLE